MRAELRAGRAPRCDSRTPRQKRVLVRALSCRARPGSTTSLVATTFGSGASKKQPGRSRRSLDLRPQDFWSNFYHGLCSFRLGRFDDAVADFRVCLAIEPGSAVAHFNRALAFDALGRSQDAYRGYSKAIELAPGLAAARLNRGIVSYKNGRHAAAVADFEMGIQSSPDRETRTLLRFNLALAQFASGDRRSALANARIALELGCREAKSLVDELR